MTTEQFAYWLQGFAELNAEPPSAEQWKSIRDHLQLVFKKETPYVAPRLGDFVRTMELRPSDVYPGLTPSITC
jgi:hypothetical protein